MTRTPLHSDNILTVLVIHDQLIETSPAYKTLTQSARLQGKKSRLFIYDNSSQPQSLPDNNEIWSITYRHDASNPGVSRAYNQAFLTAENEDLKWMLLADQDTSFPENLYEKYGQSIRSNNASDRQNENLRAFNLRHQHDQREIGIEPRLITSNNTSDEQNENLRAFNLRHQRDQREICIEPRLIISNNSSDEQIEDLRVFNPRHQRDQREIGIFVPCLTDHEGIVSPFYRGITSGRRAKKITGGKKSLDEYQAINSGLLISTRLFEASSGYDERLPLDFSDINFFNRLRDRTSTMVLVDSVCMHQHSSTQRTDVRSAVGRFRIYVSASKVMRSEYSDFRFSIRAFARAIKLSMQYRTLRFIGTYLSV